MIARSIRERTKRVPVLGPLLYHFYLKIFYREGEILTIQEGELRGKAWIRFMQTYCESYVRGDYELPVQTALAKYLRPNMVFYDVGANGGFFSLLGASLVGRGGRVVAFEPHPTIVKLLKKQVRINNMHQVDVVAAAVSDKAGSAKFADGAASDMNSLVNADKADRTIWVKTTTLDEETKRRPLPDMLKIDVEGAEIDVLRGAYQLLRTKKPILLVEIHSSELAVQYDELMAKIGYQTRDLAGNAISAAESRHRYVIQSYVISQYVCPPI